MTNITFNPLLSLSNIKREQYVELLYSFQSSSEFKITEKYFAGVRVLFQSSSEFKVLELHEGKLVVKILSILFWV